MALRTFQSNTQEQLANQGGHFIGTATVAKERNSPISPCTTLGSDQCPNHHVVGHVEQGHQGEVSGPAAETHGGVEQCHHREEWNQRRHDEGRHDRSTMSQLTGGCKSRPAGAYFHPLRVEPIDWEMVRERCWREAIRR